MSTHPPETEGKPFNPAAVGAMAGVNVLSGMIGGAPVATIGTALTPPTVTSDTSSLLAGQIVRWTLAGTLGLAQADVSSNATAIAGVWDGTRVVRPASGAVLMRFDSLPVASQPAYLSATVAGAATSTTPGILGVYLCLGQVEGGITQVGGVYFALVGPVVSQASNLSLRDSLELQTAATLGGQRKDWSTFFDHFFLGNHASGGKSLNYSNSSAFATVPATSAVIVADGEMFANWYNIQPASYLTSTLWDLIGQIKWQQGYNFFGWFNYKASPNSVAIGFCTVYNREATHLYFAYGPLTTWASFWSGATFIDTGLVLDTSFHTCRLVCYADGTIAWSLDNGALSSPLAFASGVDASWINEVQLARLGGTTGATLTMDWLYAATK